MRATWGGRPIAGKRTAAAPVSNPPLCCAELACQRRTRSAGEATNVKGALTVATHCFGRELTGRRDLSVRREPVQEEISGHVVNCIEVLREVVERVFGSFIFN